MERRSKLLLDIKRRFAYAAHPCSPPPSSVNSAGGDDPLTWLACHLGDEVEVAVVVEQNELSLLGGRGNEEIGHLASALASGGEQPLHLARSADMIGGRLHQFEDCQVGHVLVPLGGIST